MQQNSFIITSVDLPICFCFVLFLIEDLRLTTIYYFVFKRYAIFAKLASRLKPDDLTQFRFYLVKHKQNT